MHGSEKSLNRLALSMIGPRMNDIAAQIPVKTKESGLLKVFAAFEILGAEGFAVVDVDNSREFAQVDACPAESA